jgi:hypothetical protein
MRDILDPDELVRLASTDEARSSAAELTRLEHLASAIAGENTGAALDGGRAVGIGAWRWRLLDTRRAAGGMRPF